MSLLNPNNRKDCAHILIALIIVELLLAAIYMTDFLLKHPSWWIQQLFDLDRESNIPAWFSTIQLFLIGFTFIYAGNASQFKNPPSKAGTMIFGFGFIFLSLDEGAMIHEKLTWVFEDNPFVPYFDGRHGVWIVVYGVIGIILTLFLLKDLRRMWQTFRRETAIFVSGVFVYLVGAAGMETLTYFFLDKGVPLHYAIEVTVEEFTEMIGASIILYSVLSLTLRKTA